MEQSDLSHNVLHDCALEYISEPLSGYESIAALNDHGEYELSILISGVHCAACIQKIESTLLAENNIRTARLNFSTRRLAFSWEGQPEHANQYVCLIENLGYGVKPYDAKVEEQETVLEERFLLLCLGIAGFAMGNIMLLSVGVWSADSESMGIATRDLIHWISALIAIPTIFFSGRPFFRSAFKALSAGQTNMDVPISIALILASGMSLFETINHGQHAYFDSAVMLMFFLLIGRYLDFRARKQARSCATNLLSTFTGFATVIENAKSRRIPIRDLREGMLLNIASGEKFPVDGVVMSGQSEVDTSLVTGETFPRKINPECEVYAGTLNLNAPVQIRVVKEAEDSLLADIVRLMEKAVQTQAKYVRLADRAARLYTPVVHTMAVLAFVGWLFIGAEWQDALLIAVTVLIITCPCALGLAVPVVQVLASGRLMHKHILVKSGDALERLAGIDTIIFDKTGTLTLGQLELNGEYHDHNLQLAASLASHSAHPLSRALAKAYQGSILTIDKIQEHQGHGLEGLYNNNVVRLGSRSWCGDPSASHSDFIELWLEHNSEKTVFYFSDHLRPDVGSVIKKFKDMGITPYLVSGDRKNIVETIAKKIGVDHVFFEMTPLQKYEILEHLRQKGCKVLMVGDGLNDAPVLAGADVSIAPGNAIDMAQNAADIIFMGDILSPVLVAYNIANYSQSLVKQNFALAVLYNFIALPLALAGLVTPLIAALAMSGSSLVVIGNAFRLKLKT